MVRRVLPARRDLARRPRRSGPAWAGPPPLLLLATVAAVLVAPRFSDAPVAPVAAPRPTVVSVAQTPRSIEPRLVRQLELGTARGGVRSGGQAPVRLAPVTAGVASMNLFNQNSRDQAAADVRRLTSRSDVDVVGWQEANRFGSGLRGVPGWRTKTFRDGGKASELAVSWRSSEFRLLSARQRTVALGLDWRTGRYPFSTRRVAIVRLEHRATGRVLTVLDTHLPQKIEDLDDPGTWLSTINAIRARAQLERMAEVWSRAGGRWVVGTGDFNFAAAADARRDPAGGPIAALGDEAVSSYQRLGADVGPTHPPTHRNIDYVWADRAGLKDGRIAFRRQVVPGGYLSDHRPLIVRMRLS